MNIISKNTALKYIILVAFYGCFITSCSINNTATITATQVSAVKDSTTNLMGSIARDISHDGPIAWLKYFEKSPGFFMASDGQIAFANNDSATAFVQNVLVKNIKQIELQWSNIHVDVLTPTLASIGANFHEELTDFSAKTLPFDGYFTAVAEQTPTGWQLRNLHWSIAHKQ